MFDINLLAAWGEFLGGIGVIASLIYLAGQIRQNSKLLRASTTSASVDAEIALTSLLAQDSEVARTWWRGIAERDELSEDDRQRFDPLLALWIAPMRQQFQFQKDGVGSPEEWTHMVLGLDWMFSQRGGRQWWREYAGLQAPDFRQYVDDLIREGEAAE